MISWFAVHTRPQAEAKALAHLLRQGYQVYLPRRRVWVRHARRRDIVLRPLFPRYLFAGLDRTRMPWRPIRSTVGVADLVHAGDAPVAVPAKIIATLQEQEAAGIFDRVSPRQSFRLGDLVRVTEGALEDMVGRLVELREQDRVVVLLDLLGRAVRAQLDAAAVEGV
jgi:transcriptional antiterminator RfaH